MKILNFGSLNIDYVYSVHNFVKAGETISSLKRNVFCGGKGLNQSIALVRAGVEVFHAGAVGKADGGILLDVLSGNGLSLEYIMQKECDSGHAIIQVDIDGENCIIVHSGANFTITEQMIDEVLSGFSAGDYLIIQNEINLVDIIIKKAKKRQMKVILNPSPMNDAILKLPFDAIDYLILNENEAKYLCSDYANESVVKALNAKLPHISIVLTLGEVGAVYQDKYLSEPIFQPIFKTDVVDTTAAGDTFTGYFIAGILRGECPAKALESAAMAASIAVSCNGAISSIPYKNEVDSKLMQSKIQY